MTRCLPRLLVVLALAGASLSAQRGGPIRAAAHLHAVSRERHLRRRRDGRLDGDAGSGAADLRVQVDDSPQQRGRAEGRHARPVGGQGDDRDRRRPARDDLRRGRSVRGSDAGGRGAGGRRPALRRRQHRPQHRASTRSAPPSRRRRSALSTPRPADFDAFWDGKLAAQAKVPINAGADAGRDRRARASR